MIKTGDDCPIFEAINQHGDLFKIKDLIGKKNAVVFFYPKDFTPGCTKQVCSFRDHYDQFSKLNSAVIGISSDSAKSHKAFHNTYQLNYHLLSDEKNNIRKLFEVPSNLFGLIPGRVTYVIDINGVIIGTYNALVNSLDHIGFALDCLKKQS
tara:strand:- start:1131 stop:1586 length:456 start_codon:yes stop_codon:yes gene_type:complete